MSQQLPLVHAKHAGVGQNRLADFLDALINVEKDDEEDQRDAERHLGPDAEAEPQCENGCQHDAGQGVCGLHIGIEDGCDQGSACKPEAEDDAAEGTEQKGQDRFRQGDPEMIPDRAAYEPLDDALRDLERVGKEEGYGLRITEKTGVRCQMPKDEDDQRHQDLQREEESAVHAVSPLLWR